MNPQALQQQALQHLQRGELAEAERLYRHLIGAGLAEPETYANLGALCGQSQRLAEALQWLREALRQQPEHPAVLGNLAEAHRQAQTLEQLCQRWELDPPQPQGPSEAGERLHALALRRVSQHPEQAEALWIEQLLLGDQLAPVLSNLGALCHQSGRLTLMVRLLRLAVQIDPSEADAYYNLGLGLHSQGRSQEAETAYRTALHLQPKAAKAWHNLGNLLRNRRELSEAIRCFRQVQRLEPQHREVALNLATTLFLQGDYAQAWPLYERDANGKRRQALIAAPTGLPRWDGSRALRNQSLTLIAEQGLGDSLQFMRYAKQLKPRVGRLLLCLQPPLQGLAEAAGLADAVLTPASLAQEAEGYWLPLPSAAAVLRISPERPGAPCPYLQAEAQQVTAWRQRLRDDAGPGDTLVIGLQWQGNPQAERDSLRGRSLPLQAFEPLAQLPGVRFVALQKGPGHEQLQHCHFRDRFVACQSAVDTAWDFEATAALVQACDLVISSDSSLAHLAGALGQRTWLLLHHSSDWRWGVAGSSTFWYPSLRLFRQSEPENWSLVMQQVQQALLNGEAPRDDA